MFNQDTKFNYKVVFLVLVVIITCILVGYHKKRIESSKQISFLEKEKELLVKDLTLMKADVDRLTNIQEMNDIELQDSKYQIEKLSDSLVKLIFNRPKTYVSGAE